jgi:hypothetical protein
MTEALVEEPTTLLVRISALIPALDMNLDPIALVMHAARDNIQFRQGLLLILMNFFCLHLHILDHRRLYPAQQLSRKSSCLSCGV